MTHHYCSPLVHGLLLYVVLSSVLFFFFFNDTATTEIYTLSLHDALPISRGAPRCRVGRRLRPLRDAWIRRPLVGALRPADFPHLRRGAAGPGFLAARRRDRERPRSARLAVHAARRGPALHLQLLGRARDRASAPRTPRLPRAPGRDARPAHGRPGGWKGGAGAPARDVPWLARRRASFARRRDDLRGASCALRESISPSPPAP